MAGVTQRVQQPDTKSKKECRCYPPKPQRSYTRCWYTVQKVVTTNISCTTCSTLACKRCSSADVRPPGQLCPLCHVCSISSAQPIHASCNIMQNTGWLQMASCKEQLRHWTFQCGIDVQRGSKRKHGHHTCKHGELASLLESSKPKDFVTKVAESAKRSSPDSQSMQKGTQR